MMTLQIVSSASLFTSEQFLSDTVQGLKANAVAFFFSSLHICKIITLAPTVEASHDHGKGKSDENVPQPWNNPVLHLQQPDFFLPGPNPCPFFCGTEDKFQMNFL